MLICHLASKTNLMTTSSKPTSARPSGILITSIGSSTANEVLAAVKKLDGVSSVRVNPVRRSVQVEYDPTLVNATVIKAAFRASPIPFLGFA